MRPRYKPVNPDKVIRDLRKEFKALNKKLEPGPERAARAAEFAREAHGERQLNMVMHAANMCLEDDPDAPKMLIEAYAPEEVTDPEERLRAFIDLKDLARYIDNDDIRAYAQQHIDEEAPAWVADGDEAERRHRLRVLTSMFGREFADAIRDELEFGAR